MVVNGEDFTYFVMQLRMVIWQFCNGVMQINAYHLMEYSVMLQETVLEVIQWAHATGYSWENTTCIEAASNGHLNILQWA
jgi:uncharacterized membrane protein